MVLARLTASVHPLRQTGILRIERLGPSDVLPACPTASRAADRRSQPNSNSSSARLARTPATNRPVAWTCLCRPASVLFSVGQDLRR
jgi:hypothetical protein